MPSQHDPRSAALRDHLTVHAQSRDRVNQSGSPTAAKTPQPTVKTPLYQPTKRLASPGGAALANLMVGYRLDATFRALADPTRRALLARLAEGEKRVGELTRDFAISETAVAKHLALLENAGLVRRRRDGRHSFCTIVADPLTEAALWLRRWQRFEGLRAAGLRRLLDAAERGA